MTLKNLHLMVNASTGLILDEPPRSPIRRQTIRRRSHICWIRSGRERAAHRRRRGDIQTIAQHSAPAQIVIPMRSTAVRSCETGVPMQRIVIWKRSRQTGNWAGKRQLVIVRGGADETIMGRYMELIDSHLRARDPDAQHAEAAIGVTVLNRMLAAARSKSVRSKVDTA
jgi:hypothetical protein